MTSIQVDNNYRCLESTRLTMVVQRCLERYCLITSRLKSSIRSKDATSNPWLMIGLWKIVEPGNKQIVCNMHQYALITLNIQFWSCFSIDFHMSRSNLNCQMDPKPSPDPEKDEKNRSLTWKKIWKSSLQMENGTFRDFGFSMGGDGADGSLEQASVVDPLHVTLDKDGQHNARMKRMQIYANPKGINSLGFQLYTNLALVWVPRQIM